MIDLRSHSDPTALILRSDPDGIASRRMLQMSPDLTGASFETPLSRLLRMRAEKVEMG
jgi:hypothetical protein